MAVMISVNPPYSQMVLSGYKPVEFRKVVLKEMKKGDILYLYETINKSGCGKVVGEVVLEQVIDFRKEMPFSEVSLEELLSGEKYEITKVLKRHTENKLSLDELATYAKEIGLGGNFGIVVGQVVKYEEPKLISAFRCKGKRMMRPPQNMCYCEIME